MYQVCITHMMDNKPWNAENEPTCIQFIVLLVSQSILDHFGCSRSCFEGKYIYYQMSGHNQLQFWSVMTSHSCSHGFLESAVIWPVTVTVDLGKWPNLTWLVNTSSHRHWEYRHLLQRHPGPCRHSWTCLICLWLGGTCPPTDASPRSAMLATTMANLWSFTMDSPALLGFIKMHCLHCITERFR